MINASLIDLLIIPVVTAFHFFLHLCLPWYEGTYFYTEQFIFVTKW